MPLTDPSFFVVPNRKVLNLLNVEEEDTSSVETIRSENK